MSIAVFRSASPVSNSVRNAKEQQREHRCGKQMQATMHGLNGEGAVATSKSIVRQHVAPPRPPKPMRRLPEPSCDFIRTGSDSEGHAPQGRNKIKLSSKSPAATEMRAMARHSVTERHA